MRGYFKPSRWTLCVFEEFLSIQCHYFENQLDHLAVFDTDGVAGHGGFQLLQCCMKGSFHLSARLVQWLARKLYKYAGDDHPKEKNFHQVIYGLFLTQC